ncbi:MAG: pectin acetylesterase-family hydrolase [Chloroflexota bacterium]|nr:pectin acetylesterase-family hydrolase [Chloroflexota bacterium]
MGIIGRFSLIFSIISIALIIGAASLTRAPGDVWQIIDGGAGTMCAFETPYRFFARTDVSTERLAIFFQPGGGCWTGATCLQGSVIYDQSVSGSEPERHTGILDFSDAANPLRDFDVVFVPYCTGDVHLGDATQTYRRGLGRAVTVHHNGYRNARAALDWVYANYPAPAQVVIAGSSAGAVGALIYAGDVMGRYPNARALFIGDSYVGIIPPRWEALERWNAGEHLPDYITGQTLDTFTVEGLYTDIAGEYPDAAFALYTQAADAIQIFLYALAGGAIDTWAQQRHDLLDRVRTLPNLRTFVSAGFAHVALVNVNFTFAAVGERRLRDWVSELIAGATVENVSCALGTLDCP